MGSIGIFWFSTLNEILESKDLYLPYVYHDGIHKWAIEKNRADAQKKCLKKVKKAYNLLEVEDEENITKI